MLIDTAAAPNHDTVPATSCFDGYAAICDRLGRRFPGRVMRAVIERIVADEFATFTGARITSFVPLLVERRAGERLRDEAPMVRRAERTD